MFEKIVTTALISPGFQGKLSKHARYYRRLARRRFILVVLSFLFLLTQCAGFGARPQTSSPKFIVLPAVTQITSNSSSYDCSPTTFFETTHSPSAHCSAQKIIEKLMYIPYNPLLSFLAVALFCVNLLLYLRSRLLCKEVNIILNKLQSK